MSEMPAEAKNYVPDYQGLQNSLVEQQAGILSEETARWVSHGTLFSPKQCTVWLKTAHRLGAGRASEKSGEIDL
jgi:hypothetical protein